MTEFRFSLVLLTQLSFSHLEHGLSYGAGGKTGANCNKETGIVRA